MSAPQSRSPSRSTTASHPDADHHAALHRHAELLANIDAHLAALVQLTSKQQLSSPHLTIAEAAIYLGIKPDTLNRKMVRRELPFHRRPGTTPYFIRHELDKWLADPETLVVKINGICGQEDADGNQEAGPLNRETLKRLLDERADFPGNSEDRS